jgi:hypothetical protein
MSGACIGKTGLENLAIIQIAGQSQAVSTAGTALYGFAGDASSTINGKYFGQLVWSAF